MRSRELKARKEEPEDRRRARGCPPIRPSTLTCLLSTLLVLSLSWGIARAESWSLSVDSTDCRWQSTGITVRSGDAVVFSAGGQVVHWSSGTQTETVDSTECAWQPTGLKVNQGDTLVFRASGQVVCWMSADKKQKQYATPDGTTGTTSANCWLAPGLKNNALVGKIGSGSPFLIGSSKTITAGSSGTLYLAMNESSKCGGCLDNDGSWTVEIRQTAKCGPDGTTGTTSANCWLAPGLKNNALVGRIGSGSPFLIGSSKTITAGSAGTLYLGMNESSKCGGCADNDGSWWVDVRIDTPCSDDRVEPSVSISCGAPACEAGSGKISISWSGSDNCTPSSQLTFRWRLDSGAWSSWSSSKSVSYTGLAQGAHAFLIQARDQAGNVADDACDFFVDCGDDDPPDLEIHCGSISQTCQAGGATVKITWSASDNVTPSGSIQYRWKLENGGTWTAWKTNVTTTAYQPVTDGFHAFYVQAKDEAGNISDDVCDFDIDCGPGEDDEPPDLEIHCDDISQTCQANGAAAKITWSASDNATASASIQYRWKLGKSGTWSAWKANTTAVTYQGLANGACTIYVEAKDEVGNISGDACDFDVDCELEEDSDPPDITLHCGDPTCKGNGGSVTISWSATDDVTPSSSIEFRYRLGKESWTAWRSYVTTRTYSGLADGVYIFTLQARDAARNPSEEECEFEIDSCMPPEVEDKEAPAVEIKVGPVTCSAEGGEVSISWTITDDVSATGRIDRMFWLEDEDGNVVYESKWTRTETSRTFRGLDGGEYGIYINAEDEAGNLAEENLAIGIPCIQPPLSTDEDQGKYELTVRVAPEEAGSVIVSPLKESYGYGELVDVSPVPNNGWQFQRWEGAIRGTVYPRTIEMKKDEEVVAYFVPGPIAKLLVYPEELAFGSDVSSITLKLVNWGEGAPFTCIWPVGEDDTSRILNRALDWEPAKLLLSAGSEASNVVVSVNRGMLAPGHYETDLWIRTLDEPRVQRVIPVSVTIPVSDAKAWSEGLNTLASQLEFGGNIHSFILYGDKPAPEDLISELLGFPDPYLDWLFGSQMESPANAIRDGLKRVGVGAGNTPTTFAAKGKTKAEFYGELRKITSRVEPGDTFVFYYVGHADDIGIFPYFCDASVEYYWDLLPQLSTQGTDFVIIDGCMSGGALAYVPEGDATFTVVPTAYLGEKARGARIIGDEFSRAFADRCH